MSLSLEVSLPVWRTFEGRDRVFVCLWVFLSLSRHPLLVDLARVTRIDLVRLEYE
jgi:hypothetical protein